MKAQRHPTSTQSFFSANVAGCGGDESDAESGPRLDLSADTLNRALRDVAHEELAIVRGRYLEHQDPIRCAVGVSMVLRSLAEDLFGESRVSKFRGVAWLNFLLRTSNGTQLRPDFVETMSAALYGDPEGVELPSDCSFWFDVAASWIDQQCDQPPAIACAVAFAID